MTDSALSREDKIQELLGQMMRDQAIKEGHKPRYPATNMKHFTPPPSRIRKDIINHFSEQPTPLTTRRLLAHIDAKAPNLRRVCRDMIKEGLLHSVRTPEGCLYTFVGDTDSS